MESIDKLRSMRGNMATYEDLIHECCVIADEIEREIAEKYIQLPVDAEGVHWHLGDTTENGNRINGMAFDMHGWYFTNTLNDIDPSIHYHVKPRTIEDVLYECFHDCMYKYPTGIEAIISKYADELRSMGVGE